MNIHAECAPFSTIIKIQPLAILCRLLFIALLSSRGRRSLSCCPLALRGLSDFVIHAHNTRLRDVDNPVFPVCNSAGVHQV